MNAPRSFPHAPSIVPAQDAPRAGPLTGAGDESHMMRPYNDAADPWPGDTGEFPRPFPRQPKGAVVEPEVFHQVATTPCPARAVGRTLTDYDANHAAWLAYDRLANGFEARVARDHRTYLVGCAAIALGAMLMLLALYLLGPGWLRSAPSHVALNDSAWCTGFSGLSCTQQKTRKD